MATFNDPEVKQLFDTYPQDMRERLLFLRQLIFETAAATADVTHVEETLRWGQPAYIAKKGSTFRIDCISSVPGRYAMFFHCTSRLVETFRELYGDKFKFEGNRAILFDENDQIPVAELKHCILLALTYHKRKNLPLLGA